MFCRPAKKKNPPGNGEGRITSGVPKGTATRMNCKLHSIGLCEGGVCVCSSDRRVLPSKQRYLTGEAGCFSLEKSMPFLIPNGSKH